MCVASCMVYTPSVPPPWWGAIRNFIIADYRSIQKYKITSHNQRSHPRTILPNGDSRTHHLTHIATSQTWLPLLRSILVHRRDRQWSMALSESSRGVTTRFFAQTDQYGSWWDAYAPKIRGSHPGTRPYYARRGSKKSLQMSVNPYI